MSLLWHIEIEPSEGHADHVGDRLATEAVELGLAGPWAIRASRGFLVEGDVSDEGIRRAARDVLSDPVVETATSRPIRTPIDGSSTIVHVLPKPGVTDPEAESALAILKDLDYPVSNVRTIRTYRIDGPAEQLPRLIERVLANDAVEQAVIGALPLRPSGPGQPYQFRTDRGADPRDSMTGRSRS